MDTTEQRPNLIWNPAWCKRCQLCVGVCPMKNLELKNNEIVEVAKCTRCQVCVRYCPDQALALTEIPKTN